ncbi:MAG: hypothetical protein [Circular genetic element sp.]|nr:MAG: hypothetical protein [Circular genetic element sp.]
MPYKRKPKVLKGKAIKRKTGAKAQSKQIAALSKCVSSLTKSNYETVQTIWNRNNIAVDPLVGGVNAFVCPIPKSMCNCFSQSTLDTVGDNDVRIPWSDNLGLAAQPTYRKNPIFGSSEAARNSPEANHMGGVLKWRLISDEPSFSTYTVALLSPKSRQADQLITDRNLKGSKASPLAAGSKANLVEGVDFETHPDVMGSQFNTKFWNVDYYREVNFSHPGSTSQQTTAQANNTNPKNNAIIAQGTIKLKPGGVLKCFNNQSFKSSGSPDLGLEPMNASQIGYVDEKNEKLQYLVIINNGVSADLETVNLSLLVRDYYKMVV